LFLGNLRAAVIVALAIPLSMLFAFSGMLRFGISASLLSLGAIDFGMLVDSSVVMIENCVRHIAHGDSGRRSQLDVIRDAAVEVRRPTMFGELIIMIVYLPILTLEGIEGKLFRPMALTVIFALAGSMILSLTLMPVLASLLLPRHIDEREPLLMRLIKRLYAPILDLAMRHKLAVVVLGVSVLVLAFGVLAPNLGSEFGPWRSMSFARPAPIWMNRFATTPAWNVRCWRRFPTKSSTSGAASARPKWPPTRWAWNSPTFSSRSRRARNGKKRIRRPNSRS
jgi:cobalt-zinc-cadmium resistance protein CzcA